jgi:hypothetical protein
MRSAKWHRYNRDGKNLSVENRTNKESSIYSQISRLENLKELQLNANHDKIPFLTVLLLFENCKTHCW